MKTELISKLGKCALQSLIAFAILIQMCSLQTYAQSGDQVTETDGNVTRLIGGLLAIVGESQEGVEIQLHGSCVIPDSEVIVVPTVLWEDVNNEGDRAAIIRAALRDNKHLSVVRVSPNVIVVRDAAVAQGLLETKIDSLSLSELEQYSPEAAIMAAIHSKAIQIALRQLHMRQAVSGGGLMHVNASGEPHLGRHLRNVTLSGALSSVLETFGGLVVYEDCVDSQGERRFLIHYYK